MENWEKVFCGIIPFDLYTCELINGEMNGLVISLESKRYAVTINFGIVLGLRMFDEGCLLNEWPPLEVEKKYRGYKNVIYRIYDGELQEMVRKNTEPIYDDDELFHYGIVTMDYIIDVVTQWEPEITVKDKRIRDDNAEACD